MITVELHYGDRVVATLTYDQLPDGVFGIGKTVNLAGHEWTITSSTAQLNSSMELEKLFLDVKLKTSLSQILRSLADAIDGGHAHAQLKLSEQLSQFVEIETESSEPITVTLGGFRIKSY